MSHPALNATSTRRARKNAARQIGVVIDALEHRRLLATFSVDPSATPADAADGKFPTIHEAVNAAAAVDGSDTINVAAGTYVELVEIGTPVTLNGAKSSGGVRGANESVVQGQLAITAPGVTIAGFTVIDGAATTQSTSMAGVYVSADGSTVEQNIITGARAGAGIVVSSAASSILANNVISGWATGISISAAGTTDISDNNVFGNATAGMALQLGAAEPAAVTVTRNTLNNPAAQLTLDAAAAQDSVTLDQNDVTLAAGATFITAASTDVISGVAQNTFTLPRAATEDASLSIDLSGVDGTDLISVGTTPAGTVTFAGTTASFTPAANFNGTASFSFQTAGEGTHHAAGTVTLVVAPVNDAPTSTSIPPQSVQEHQTSTLALADYFSDVDAGDTLAYTIEGAPRFVALDAATGVLTFAPGDNDAGSYSFDAVASDGTASSRQTITLHAIRGSNTAPVIDALPSSVSIAENTTGVVYDVDATDPDGDGLTYSIASGNAAGHFAIDSATGVISLVSALDAENVSHYTLTVRVTDNGEPAPASADALLDVNVTDVNEAAGNVTISGPSSGVEGQLLMFTAAATDPDASASFSYRWFVDGVVQAGETAATFSRSFQSEASHTIGVEATDRAGTPTTDSIPVAIGDAPPAIALSVSSPSVNEQSSFTLNVGPITDPNPDDVATIGQLSIDWGDGTFDIINSATSASDLGAIRAGNGISRSHTYSDGSNVPKPIQVRVYDADGNATTTSTSILVNNVAPIGTFAAITPSVSTGSNATVNWFSQSDVSPDDQQSGLRYTYAIDTNANGTLDSSDILVVGDGTYEGSVTTSTATIPGTLLTQAGTYKILGLLLDKDSAPALTRSLNITVTAGVFRVVALGGDHSGFTVVFNQKIDTSALNIYDGGDASVDVSDIVLTRANGSVVKGSFVLNAAGNGFDYVVTGNIISAGTYNVLLRSGSSGFKALGGGTLDGDNNGIAGGNFASQFGVNAPPGPVLSIPAFARGPGQNVDINPLVPTSDLPVTVSVPLPISSLNFQIRYNASILTIRPPDAANGIADVYPGADLPAGWKVSYAVGTNLINVMLTKQNPSAVDIGLGTAKELVKINASVPNDPSLYGKVGILSFANIVVNGNAGIEGTANRAVQKAVYLGDANFDGTVNAGDSAMIETVVLSTLANPGFDNYQLIDPTILVDSTRNNAVDAQDATNAALAGFTGARPLEIPDFTPVALPASLGPDPTYALPNVIGAPGSHLSIPLSVSDDARGIQAGLLRLTYDPTRLMLSGNPVLSGALLAQGWDILTNVNAAEGYIEIAFYSGDAIADASAVVGTLLTLEFDVAANAADGVIPLSISTPSAASTSPTLFFNTGGRRLATAAVSGSVVIDTIAPTATPATFAYAGNGQSLTVTFSEDVHASIDAGDFQLTDVATENRVDLVVASISADGKTVVLTFANTGGITNSMLADGNYRLRVRSGTVADAAGNLLAADVDSDFFFMNGDVNHDRKVDFADLVILAQHYTKSSGATFADADLNYDGAVNFQDLVLLAQRYNRALAAPAITASLVVGGSATNKKTKPMLPPTL